MPRITVLMAVYNGERHLREAVDSILQQSFGDFEFLIFDDGSTDNTRDLLRTYDDRRIRLIDNGTNLGLTRTLNRGMRIAAGEFLARQDADDVSAPERLEKQLSFLDAHRDVVMVGSWYKKIDETGQPLGDRALPSDPTDLRFCLLFYCPFVHSAVMFRRDSVLSGAGLYDETIHYAQDHDLWSRIARRDSVANLPEYLLSYRIADLSMSSTYGRAVDDDHDRIVTTNVRELLGSREVRRIGVSASTCRLMRVLLTGVPRDFDPHGVDRAVVSMRQLHQSFCAYYGLSAEEARTHRSKVFSAVKNNLIGMAHRFADHNRYVEARQCVAGAMAARFSAIFEDGTWRLAAKLVAGPRTVEALRRMRRARTNRSGPGAESVRPPTASDR